MTKRAPKPVTLTKRQLETALSALPCACGRAPRLVETGFTYGAAWDWGCLIHCELRCPRWFRKCLRIKKDVSKSSPWHRWREDLVDEWNTVCGWGEAAKVGRSH